MRNFLTHHASRWIAAVAGCALMSCASESRIEPAVIDSRPAEAVAITDPQPRLTRISGIMDRNTLAWGPETWSGISGNGKYVAFLGKVGTALFSTERVMQLFIYDVDADQSLPVELQHESERLVPVNRKPALSDDGSWVAFLTAEDFWGKPGGTKAFVCEWRTGTVLPIDVHRYGIDPNEGPMSMDFSGDMSRVVVELAGTAGPAYCLLIDRVREEGRILRPPSGGPALQASVSADGRLVAILSSSVPNDPSIQAHSLWLHDVRTGRYDELPFERWADAEALERLVRIDELCISRSGRYIALAGASKPRTAPNTPPTSILLIDRSAEIVSVVSRGQDGQPADSPCYLATPSEAGNCVIFASSASNLVPGDRNEIFDIFRFDCETRRTECISANVFGQPGNGFSFECDVADDGGSVVFASRASDLVIGDRNKTPDIFLWQR